MTEQLIIVDGRVQGVGYRDFVQKEARGLSVRGTVRNLAAGGVEVVAQGSPEALRRLVESLRQGPRGALVVDVRLSERAADRTYDSFEVISNED